MRVKFVVVTGPLSRHYLALQGSSTYVEVDIDRVSQLDPVGVEVPQ